MTTIRNINPNLGDTVEFASVEEMASALAACGYTTEDGQLVEGRDYEVVPAYHYTAEIADYELGLVQVTERLGNLATSGDAVLQSDHALTDQEVEAWINRLAAEEWAAPETRHYSDLTITIRRAGEVTLGQWTGSLDTAAELMDDGLRERLHSEMAGAAPQAFLDAYCAAHKTQFGSDFAVS